MPPKSRMPTIFLAHGAPPLLDDAAWVDELHGWAASMARPTAILMISAHWEKRPIALGATRTVPLVYDFYGFPQRYYQVQYPAPGAPALAKRVRELLAGETVIDDPERGLDHGAYVPLVAMYPEANVPVLQISLPTMDARELFALGKKLAPLRDEGVLIVGSGFLIHNLRALRGFTTSATASSGWASEFDEWITDVLRQKDADALVDYRKRAPAVDIALPTHEHFVPVVTAAGAAASDPVSFPITGYLGGVLTRRSVQFG